MSYPTFKAVLKHVRKAILNKRYQTRFICITLQYILEDTYNINGDSVLVRRYQKIIDKQLGHELEYHIQITSYEKWLQIYHPETYKRMTYDNVQQGRIQWIDHMLTRKDL